MLEILQYIFSSPWIFIGTIMLIYAIGEAIGNIVANIYRVVIEVKAIKYSNIDNELCLKG